MTFHGKPITVTLTPSGQGATDILANLCVSSIGDITATASLLDATCHGSSNWKKYIGGIAEISEVPITVDYKDKSTTDALWAQLGKTVTAVFSIPHESSTDTLTIDVVITSVGVTMAIDSIVRTPISVKPSGAPTWATST